MSDQIAVLIDEKYAVDEFRDDPKVEIREYPLSAQKNPSVDDLAGMNAVIGYVPDLPAEAFEQLDRDLQLVMRPGAGFDNVDIDVATQHDIVVTHAPEAPRDAVVEGVIGMMISCGRSLHVHNARIRTRGFDGRTDVPAFELGGCTVGILGLGNVGKRLADYLTTFGTEVLAYDPYIADEAAERHGVERVDLESLLTEADFVTVHVPLTDETEGMIREDHFRQMKESAFLVNAARGGIYEDAVLARAIRRGWIAGAAVDVYENRGSILENPLLELDETAVLLTPHVLGNVSEDAQKRLRKSIVETIRCLREDHFPPNIVNEEVYEGDVPNERRSNAF